MGPGDVCWVPPAAVRHGRARQMSGTGPCEEVKVQGRDLVRVVSIVAPLCPTRGWYPRKIRFIEPQRLNGHRRPVRGAPSSGTPQERQVVLLFHNVPYRVPLLYRETPSPQSTPLL